MKKYNIVNLLTAKEGDVISEFQTRMLRSISAREYIVDSWIRGYDYWSRFIDTRDDAHEESSRALRIPLIPHNIHTQSLRFENFSHNIDVNAKYFPLAKVAADGARALIKAGLNAGGYDMELPQYALHRHLFGTSFLKVGWRETVEMIRVEEPVLVPNTDIPAFDIQGATPRMIPTLVDRPYYQEHTCAIESVAPWEVFPDPDTGHSIYETDWVIHQEWMHIDDIKRMGENPQTKWKNIGDLGTGQWGDAYLIHNPNFNEDSESYEDRMKDHVLIHTIWDRRQNAVVVIANDTEILYRGKNPFQSRDKKLILPFIQGRDIIEPNMFWGRASWTMIEDAVRAYERMFNDIVVGVSARSRPAHLVNSAMFDNAGRHRYVSPGETIPVNAGMNKLGEAVQRIDFGNSDPNINYTAGQILEIVKMVGSPQVSGSSTDAELATQVMVNAAQSDILDKGLKSRASKFELTPLYTMVLNRVAQFMPQEIMDDVLTANGVDIEQFPITGSVLSNVDLSIKVDIEEDKGEQWKRTLTMEQLQALPGIVGSVPNLDTAKLVGDIWKNGYGYDFSDYMKSPEQIMQEQQQAMMMQGAIPPQQGGKDMVVPQQAMPPMDGEDESIDMLGDVGITMRGNGRPMVDEITEGELYR